jgi:acetyltransferase-like isoleucine patch superfamily enzyme
MSVSGRTARRLVDVLLIGAARITGLLPRLMNRHLFRRVLTPVGRRAAWCRLGAQIDPSAHVGPRVAMRIPRNVRIGAGSRIGGRVWIDSWGEISIGDNVLMNGEIDLFATQHLLDHPRFRPERRSITIGDYVWLPWKVIVLPGARIGNYAVVGSGSVVSGEVEDYAVVAGNPARKIRERARIDYTYVPTRLGAGRRWSS